MDDTKIRLVIWVGNSLDQVKSFPVEVRKDIGSGLYDAQKGDKRAGAKPFKGVGSGVFELVSRFDTNTYRTLYAVQIGERIYVFTCLPEEIEYRHVDLIKQRYKRAVDIEKEKSQ